MYSRQFKRVMSSDSFAVFSYQLCWKNAALLYHFYPTNAHTKITILLFSVTTLPQLLSLSFLLAAGLIQSAGRMKSHRGRGKQHEWPVHLH